MTILALALMAGIATPALASNNNNLRHDGQPIPWGGKQPSAWAAKDVDFAIDNYLVPQY